MRLILFKKKLDCRVPTMSDGKATGVKKPTIGGIRLHIHDNIHRTQNRQHS